MNAVEANFRRLFSVNFPAERINIFIDGRDSEARILKTSARRAESATANFRDSLNFGYNRCGGGFDVRLVHRRKIPPVLHFRRSAVRQRLLIPYYV